MLLRTLPINAFCFFFHHILFAVLQVKTYISPLDFQHSPEGKLILRD